MKIQKLRFIYNSISFKIFLIIIIILTPLVSFLIYNNYRIHESLLKEVKDTHKNMLQSYIMQIDNQLNNSTSYALEMILFQTDPYSLLSTEDESTIAHTKNRIFLNLSNRLLSNNLMDSFFLYVKSKDYFIIANKYNVSSSELEEIQKYVISTVKNESRSGSFPKSNWNFTKIDGNNSLINICYGTNDLIAGAYTSTDRYLENYKQKNPSNLEMLFIAADNLNMVNKELPSNTLLINSKSSSANIFLAEIIPEEYIFNTLPVVQKYLLLISIFLILIIPVFILLMKFTVVDPLHILTKSMIKIRSGDLHYRIKSKHDSNEFELVNATFNGMMDEVQNLKINVYEQQIKVQKSQLRNLQLQIKPHFLINSLNMVNNLIINENYSSAKELILYSVNYFRYMTRVDDDFVALNDEITHVTNYLEIQKIRYKDKFDYSIKTNQLIEDMLIPPMLLISFIENSIKYAIEMSKFLNISINVEYFEIDYYPYAKIVLSDTGVGYPIDILERINSGKKITDAFGDHIGIFNSVQRMKILYDGKASWKFYNAGGAVSELILPALFEKE